MSDSPRPPAVPILPVWACRLLAAMLILGAAGLHFAYLAHNCPLDLSPDEAHYWDWSRHLDLSYYSKGPLVAYLIRAGCVTAGFPQWDFTVLGLHFNGAGVSLPGGGLLRNQRRQPKATSRLVVTNLANSKFRPAGPTSGACAAGSASLARPAPAPDKLEVGDSSA